MRVLMLAALAVLVPGLAQAAPAIRINEFLPDPAGSDPGFEWVEFYNADSVMVDLSGYKLQKQTVPDATPEWTLAYQFPTGQAITQLDPGEFLLVADTAVNIAGADLYKGTGATSTMGIFQGTGGDGLRLVDGANGLVDLVVYGGVNTDLIHDEDGNVATSIAPSAAAGFVLYRSPNGADTNLPAVDFRTSATATMKAANPSPPACDLATGLVINEILPDPANADDNNEYLEIYNGAGRTVSLLGWKLEWGTSSYTGATVFDDTVVIEAGDFLVVGGTGVGSRDVTANFSPNMGNATSADAVRLVACNNTPVDTVVYGTPNSDGWDDDSGADATSLAPFAASKAIARKVDGLDTNASALDFQTTATLTPGAANPAPVACEANDGRVVINEFLPDPTGADSPNEWVELYNNGAIAAKVLGWTIRTAGSGSTFTVRATLPDFTIPSHGRMLVGESGVVPAPDYVSGALSMGVGDGGSAVRLVDCIGTVADTVAYGDPLNPDGVLDDSGQPATSLAPLPGEGPSLARWPDGTDTNQSGDDFLVFTVPTPGAVNEVGPASTGHVVINEFLADPITPDPPGAGGDAGFEWIELYNLEGTAVNVAGYKLQKQGTGTGTWSTMYTFPIGNPNTLIQPGDYLVVADDPFWVTGADFYKSVSEARTTLGIPQGTGGDGIRLIDSATHLVDLVVYGGVNTDLIKDEGDVNVATSIAPKPTEGSVLARGPNAADTDLSGDDFLSSASSTMGGPNPNPPTCDLAAGLVINEILPDPVGANDEYIELYNGAGRTVQLSGWLMEWGSSSFSQNSYIFPSDVEIAAGGYLLIGESGVAGADVTRTLDMSDATNSDAIKLCDCTATTMDTLVYGTPNSDGWIDDNGAAATSLAPFVTHQAIARRLDGVDTNLSAADFHTTASLSPKLTNPVPGACDTNDDQVVINEFLPDPFSTDAGNEWIELYNNGAGTVSLEGWTVRKASSGDSFDVVATLASGLSIPSHAYFLIGESSVPGRDATATLALGTGGGGDALRLVDCAGNPADTVAYGDAGNADGVVDDSGLPSTSLAAKPQEGRSLARETDGVDTDFSADDFVVYAMPNPRGENIPQGNLAGGRVVINEFLANPAMPNPPPVPAPPGGDVGFEWVEIYNLDTVQVDVAGYKLQKQTSGTTWSTMYTFPTGNELTKIAPGGYVVVADDATYVAGATFYKDVPGSGATLSIPQGTNGDALQIIDTAGTPLDIVVYGGVNTDNLKDESGSIATSIAPYPTEGYALARSPNGTDTSLSGADFIATNAPTLGAANPDPPTCDIAAGLVINEFVPDPAGTDTGNEYIEIYNGAGRTVTLEGWKIDAGSSSFGTKVVIGAGVTIEAEDFLVIGESLVASRDVTAVLAMGNASSTADGVRLVDCHGDPADTVIYGTPNTDGWGDDLVAPAVSLAPMVASQAIARRLDGVDTNLSADDFQSTPTLTPGATNPAASVCQADLGGVVINEFVPNPAGADTGNEWVELYNGGAAAVRIDGWTMRVASSGSTFSVKMTMPSDTEIPSHGRILVGEANVANRDVTGVLAMGSGSGGDAVRLVDCAANVVDTVAYGEGGNADGVVDDSGIPALSLAPDPGDAQALARKRDGVDTDQSGDDFAATSTPTPGEENPELICIQNTGNVKINEILPDPDGSDSEAAAEFIELYNGGSAAVDLDGWQIITSGAGDDRAVDIVFPPATRIPAETWLVIGNSNVAEADIVSSFSMGNGTGGDGVYLLDCTGAMVDFVGYGADNADLITNETGLIAELPPNPGSAKSLARSDDGVDTNVKDDWFVDATPTPGGTNFQDDVVVPPDDEPGCRRGNAPDDNAPGGSCSTNPLPFGGFEFLPLLFAIRRRRA